MAHNFVTRLIHLLPDDHRFEIENLDRFNNSFGPSNEDFAKLKRVSFWIYNVLIAVISFISDGTIRK